MSQAEVFAEPTDLVQSLMQDRNDTDILVREPVPINEVMFVAKAVAFDAEFGGDGAREYPVACDAFKCLEQTSDIAIGLLAPAITGLTIDFVEPIGRRFLDADLSSGHLPSGPIACDHIGSY